MSFDFQNGLITFEMANNHQGDLEHAQKIVSAMSALARKHGVRAAIKLQLRNLDTFIHSSADPAGKVVKRFRETRLDAAQLSAIVEMIRAEGMITMATVFDEDSIGTFQDLRFDILKVASCSAQDYPLLRELAPLNVPLILSTASLSLSEVDAAVQILRTDQKPFAIMHCVGLYPTPNASMLLDRIDQLKELFPEIPVGFSTHEHPDALLPMQLAAAKGVRLFEKHVDVPSSKYSLNAYSATPEQVDRWLGAYLEALEICSVEQAGEVHERERQALRGLKRAVFARGPLRAGSSLVKGNVTLAFPASEGQMLAEDFGPEGLGAATPKLVREALEGGSPVMMQAVEAAQGTDLRPFAERAIQVVRDAGIRLPAEFHLEVSHHYGPENFPSTGAVLITVLNRGYCKKLMVLFASQAHPPHYHLDREESLCLLSGKADLILDGKRLPMAHGEYLHLPKGSSHEFIAHEDCVIEEISFLAEDAASHYLDDRINKQTRADRKTPYQPASQRLRSSPLSQDPGYKPRDLE